MPRDNRKGAWSFDTLCTVPTHMFGPTSSTDRIYILSGLDSAFKRDVVERPEFPSYIRNVEIKYKLSDLDSILGTALANSRPLPVTGLRSGYIQSEINYKIEFGNLLCWFQANWSPVDGQMVRNGAYLEWSRQDPANRHVQVHGTPAVAKRSPGKKQVSV